MQELTDDILLYHENYAEISSIDLSYSRSTLDFEKGFYLNSSYEQALNYIPYASFLSIVLWTAHSVAHLQ